MPALPCDIDPDEEVDQGQHLDLLDLLARSLAIAKGERHLSPVPTQPHPPKES